MTLVVFCSILPLLKGSGGVKELLTFLRVEKGANYFSVLKKRESMTTQRAFIRLLESPEGVLLRANLGGKRSQSKTLNCMRIA